MVPVFCHGGAWCTTKVPKSPHGFEWSCGPFIYFDLYCRQSFGKKTWKCFISFPATFLAALAPGQKALILFVVFCWFCLQFGMRKSHEFLWDNWKGKYIGSIPFYGLQSLISNSGFGSNSLGAIHTESGSYMKCFFMTSRTFNGSCISLYILETLHSFTVLYVTVKWARVMLGLLCPDNLFGLEGWMSL